MARKRKRARRPLRKPQFFKILLPGFSQKLTIPPLFNEYIVGEVQKKAIIVSPLGKSWPMEVHKVSNCYYFGEGWQEFSRAHGLNVGYFLVFRYEGEMVFTATIFDRTTWMKEYNPSRGGNKMGDNFYSHVDVKPSDSPNQNANLAGTCTDGSQFEIELSSFNPCDESYLPLPQEFVKYYSEGNDKMATIFCPLGEPWHVLVHKDCKGLHFADGWQRFAAAHCLRRGDSLVFKHKGALIFNVIFDNNICETDCNPDVVSEVMNGGIPIKEEKSTKDCECLEVPQTFLCGKRVYDAVQPMTDKRRQVGREAYAFCNEDDERPDVANGSGRITHFEVAINLSKCNYKYTLEIPTKFSVTSGLSSIKQLLLIDPNGHSWPVGLSHGSPSLLTAHAGWRDFFVTNNLQDGDVCLFELKEKNELHVKIHRGRCLESMRSLKDISMKPKRPVCGQTADQLVKSAVHHQAGRGRIFQDYKVHELMDAHNQGTQFTCIIFPSSILGLNIPSSFSSLVDLSSLHRIILLDPKAQQWIVNIYHWKAKTKHKVKTGRGWKAFCASNNVEVGDKCIFKLASTETNDVFNVSIIKQEVTMSVCMSGH